MKAPSQNCLVCDSLKAGRQNKFCSRICYWQFRKENKMCPPSRIGSVLSEKHKDILKGNIGEKSGGWKGSDVGYHGIHHWLNKNFGKADCCENFDCIGKSKVYHWAKLKGVLYERKRENFIKLCASCHRKYDMTPQLREKAIRNLVWNTV